MKKAELLLKLYDSEAFFRLIGEPAMLHACTSTNKVVDEDERRGEFIWLDGDNEIWKAGNYD